MKRLRNVDGYATPMIIVIIIIFIVIVAGGIHLARTEYRDTHVESVSTDEHKVLAKRIDKKLLGKDVYIITFEFVKNVEHELECDKTTYDSVHVGDVIWVDKSLNKDNVVIDSTYSDKNKSEQKEN